MQNYFCNFSAHQDLIDLKNRRLHNFPPRNLFHDASLIYGVRVPPFSRVSAAA